MSGLVRIDRNASFYTDLSQDGFLLYFHTLGHVKGSAQGPISVMHAAQCSLDSFSSPPYRRRQSGGTLGPEYPLLNMPYHGRPEVDAGSGDQGAALMDRCLDLLHPLLNLVRAWHLNVLQ